jgi:hypothetical protein
MLLPATGYLPLAIRFMVFDCVPKKNNQVKQFAKGGMRFAFPPSSLVRSLHREESLSRHSKLRAIAGVRDSEAFSTFD